MGRIFDDLEVEEERPDYAGRWPLYLLYPLYSVVLLPRFIGVFVVVRGIGFPFSFPLPLMESKTSGTRDVHHFWYFEVPIYTGGQASGLPFLTEIGDHPIPAPCWCPSARKGSAAAVIRLPCQP